VPKLLVTVSAGARDLRDLVIDVDGHPTTAAMWGVLVPVDPGTHVVTTSASEKKTWNGSVDVAEGATAAIEVPALEDAIVPAPAPPPAPVAPPRPQPAAPPAPPPPRIQPPPVVPVDVQTPQWSGQKTGGVVLMGLGGAGAVAGVVWAVLAHQQSGVLDATCPSHVGCAPGLTQAVSQYGTYRTAEVVAFASAGAVFGTGVVVYLTAPTAPTRPGAVMTARFGIGYAGVEGSF
jgi:serine/threonine-protein kinase